MTTVQAKIPTHVKQRSVYRWFTCFVLVLGIPILFYYGYCWGLWGRGSLLLQYLFQCSCPPASEEARYSEHVDVLISACRDFDVFVRLSPSGYFLYVREIYQEMTSAYLLDLETKERTKVTNQEFTSFLTDDLWFVESGIEGEIIDRLTGTQYPIKTFRFWREDAYVNGEPNVELLISALHQADKIFFTQNNDIVVVLMPNFTANVEQNFTFGRSDVPGGDSNRVEHFLQENQVKYQTILADIPVEVISPNRRFVAREDGIYLVETNQLIIKAYPSLVRGWTYDGRGVIYASQRCLFRINFPFADDTACLFKVSQPVLLLKVPEEYLTPTPP